jgi:hypothetical protein
MLQYWFGTVRVSWAVSGDALGGQQIGRFVVKQLTPTSSHQCFPKQWQLLLVAGKPSFSGNRKALGNYHF